MRAAATEIVAVALYLATMLALIFGGAGLGALIAASGALPLYSGTLSALVARRAGLGLRFQPSAATRPRVMSIVPTAGWLLVVELCNMAMYAFGRIVLGAYRSPTAVGLLRGAGARAQPALRARRGARRAGRADRLALRRDRRPAPPARARRARHALHARAVRAGLRDADRAGRADPRGLARRSLRLDGDVALAILVSYWLLYGGLVVTPGFLVGAGRARDVARIMVCVAAANLALALALTPGARRRGPGGRHRGRRSSWRSRSWCGSACRPRGRRSATSPAAPGRPTTCSARCSRSRWSPAGPCCRWTRRSAVVALAAGGVLAYWARLLRRWCSTRRERGAGQPPRLSSLSSGASRSRADTSSSSPSGHSMPTSGSSKRKPDSLAGS